MHPESIVKRRAFKNSRLAFVSASTKHPAPSLLTQLLGLPYAPALVGCVFLLGFAMSFALPYLALFAVKAVHMTPVQVGLFLTLNALGAIGVSTQLAKWSDQYPRRKPMVVLTLLAGVLAYGLLAVVRDPVLLLVVGCVLMGTASAAFPQVFAFARARWNDSPSALAERGVTVLRAVFSFAWVIGPGLGAWLLANWSFVGVFVASAICYVLALVSMVFLPERVLSLEKITPIKIPIRPLILPTLAFTLYGMAMNMGFSFFPLLMTQDLPFTEAQVGGLVAFCALLEIPCMAYLVAGKLPSTEKLIKLAFVFGCVHFVMTALVSQMWLMVLGQVVRAVMIAVMAGLGMQYFQELLPGRLAAATTLFSNTGSLGSLLGGLLAGGIAQWMGYRAVFWVCALLTVVGWVIMMVYRPVPKKLAG